MITLINAYVKFWGIIFLLSLCPYEILCGQQYTFKHYSIDQGLGQAKVTSMCQDHHGIIWFGTNGGGISSFDGHQFIVYTTDEGLVDNDVNFVMEDKEHNLWICTSNGVSRINNKIGYINGSTPVFINYSEESGLAHKHVNTAVQDDEGAMLFGTNDGLSKLIAEQGKEETVLFSNSKLGLSHNVVMAILQDKTGVLWIGTESGLTRYNPYAPQGASYTYYSTNDGLADDFISSIFEDSEGTIWIGTKNGISKYIPNDFRRSTDKFESITNVGKILLADISDILEDQSGSIWFAGRGDVGAIEYLPRYNLYRRLTKKHGLEDNDINVLLEDNEGNLWLGSYGTGVSKFTGKVFENYTRELGMPDNFTRTVVEDINHNIWVGNNNGGVTRLIREKSPENFSGYNFTIQNYSKFTGFISDKVYTIISDRSGNLWFCTEEGLARLLMPVPFLIPEGETLPRLKFQKYNKSNGMISDRVRMIYEDSRGVFWIAYVGGKVQKLTISMGKLTFHEDILHHKLVDEFNTNAIHEDKMGHLWFGTEAGMVQFSVNDTTQDLENPVSITVKEGLAHNDVRAITEDKEGNLWIGTIGGMSKIQPYQTNKRIVNFSEEDGLLSSRISVLKIDKDQNLWVGSSLGVSKFDLIKYSETIEKFDMVDFKFKSSGVVSFKNYGYQEGFSGNEINTNASCIDNEGCLWFGTIMGLIKFNPIEVKTIEVPPIIKLLGLELYSKSDGIISINISDEGKFNFSAAHYTFKFLGISHTIPKKVVYQYKLDGYTYNWSEPTTSTSVTFNGLPAGSYTFRVKSGNADGVWNKNPISYNFTILPPFWKSAWFYLIVIFLLGLLIYAFIKIRIRTLERAAHILKEQVDIKTIELKASEKQYRNLFEKISDSIFVFEKKTHKFLDCNETVLRVYNYTKEELRKMTPFDLHPEDELELVKKTINLPTTGNLRTYTHLTKHGHQIFVEIASDDIEYNKKDAMLCIVRDITERKKAAEKIERINIQLTSSIRYAKRILDSILQSMEGFQDILPGSFILFKPKDIVSGDFYWYHKKDNKIIIAVVDCMGHGIGGAFMSLIANELLQDIIINRNILNPPEILAEMHKGVVSVLTEDGKVGATAGGMDFALCSLDYNNNILEFAGAGRRLQLYRDGNEKTYAGNKSPIGLVLNKDGKYSDEYYNTEQGGKEKIKSDKIKVKKGDTFYLFTDGYCDQFGGKAGEKFMRDRFSKVLLEIQKKSMAEQKVLLDRTITDWQGSHSQIDDILVVGVRV
ncbi:MAG TPA: PAS domain S-box protein [Flavobacteriales bacterium]|nr:PAS domain S-box protein [Flavobacteriales bacterium]